MSDLGARLRKARDRKNYSQIQVKEKTGIHNKTLSGYETGRNEPDYETLNVLAELYDESVQWLLTGEIAEQIYGTSYSVPRIVKVLAEYNLDLEDPETYELVKKAIEFVKFAQSKK